MEGTFPSLLTYDCIIVGAGAAGCVLAGRLSEIEDKRVLLIEAGPDAWPGHEHADITDPFPISADNRQFLWDGLRAEAGAKPDNGSQRISTPFRQGLGVGGTSNINGMAADRGIPSDYDEWRDLGATGWGWSDVLPYFRRLEHDQDFDGPLHGKSGPIPIRRVRPQEWAPFAKAWAAVLKRQGVAMVEDYNGEVLDGVSSVPMSCLPGRRVSASMAYLTEEVRSRPNLVILANLVAQRLHTCDGRVSGIEARTAERSYLISAPEIIVSCGAIQSPALLLRSGIGPASQLRPLGIKVVRDLRGVGRNLQNHPAVYLITHLPATAMQPSSHAAWQQNQLRYSSKVAGCPEHDMLIMSSSRVAWHALGRSIASLVIFVHKAYSRGSVDLQSANTTVMPRVSFNLLEDSRDFDRLVRGLKMALSWLGEEELMQVHNQVFLPDGGIVARLATRSLWNRVQAWGIAIALRSALFRRVALRRTKIEVQSMAKDEHSIRNYVRMYSQAVGHVCGSCRMGNPDNPETVVDPECRVVGVGGLRVVDASVFPSVPRGNTHLPVIMVAEKMADQIKGEWRRDVGRMEGHHSTTPYFTSP